VENVTHVSSDPSQDATTSSYRDECCQHKCLVSIVSASDLHCRFTAAEGQSVVQLQQSAAVLSQQQHRRVVSFRALPDVMAPAAACCLQLIDHRILCWVASSFSSTVKGYCIRPDSLEVQRGLSVFSAQPFGKCELGNGSNSSASALDDVQQVSLDGSSGPPCKLTKGKKSSSSSSSSSRE